MSDRCLICLEPVDVDDNYHPRCVHSLFGVTRAPRIEIQISKLHTAALAMIGNVSLSGIQKKVSVGLSVDRETLQVAAENSFYILKPPTETFP